MLLEMPGNSLEQRENQDHTICPVFSRVFFSCLENEIVCGSFRP